MGMFKDLRLLCLLLIAAVGFAFEGIRQFQFKSPAHESDLAKAASAFAINRDSTVHEAQPSIQRRPKAQTPRIANPSGVKFDLASAISSYQKEHGLQETDTGAKKRPDKLKPEAAKDEAKKKKADKYEYAYDYQRGRWVKRLKMSEDDRLALQAKKQLEKMKKLQEQQKKLAEMKEASATASNGSYVVNGGASQNQQIQNQENANEASQKSYEEWAQLLLRQPNKANMIAFIEAFRSNNVSSDVFYRIAGEMVEDPRPEMKSQGLELADYFPSVQSFRVLARLMDQGHSELYFKAEKTMFSDYASVSGLNVLARVMKSTDEQILLAATRTLQEAIRTLLKSTPTTEPGKTSVSYAANFTPFLTLLAELKEFGGDLASRATQTLSSLQSSLGNQTVATIN